MFKVNELLKATQGKLINSLQDIVIKDISIDSRTIKKGEAFIAIKGNNFDGHDFIDEAIRKGASCIITEAQDKEYTTGNTLHAARKIALIEVKDTQKALGDIATFKRKKFDIPIIAITGSNGKTTVKEMIAWILSKRFKVLKNEGTKNNHIGLPLTLLNLNSGYEIAVLEIGTNHFGEVSYLSRICQPNIGIITNIGPAHLEYFKDLKGVFKEKYSLITNLKKPYIAILNADDGLLKGVIKKIKTPAILGFSTKNQSDFFGTDIKNHNGKIEFLVKAVRNITYFGSRKKISNGTNLKNKFTPTPLEKATAVKPWMNRDVLLAKPETNKATPVKVWRFTLKTLGYYNIYNALAAIALARIFGMEYKDIASRLSSFEFPQSRLKFIKSNHIKFIDDTYNSNPTSLKQALDALHNLKTKGRKILVMGDMLELGSRKKTFHYQAGRYAARVCDTIITVGELSKLAAAAARFYGFDVKNIFTCKSCNEARGILFNKIYPKEDDIVLVKGSRLMKMEEIFNSR